MLREGGLALRAIDPLVGDAGGAAPGPVLVPGLARQIQLAVQERVEVVARRRVAQVDADDAVVGLAGGPAVLPLDACRLGSLPGETGLVQDADRFGVAVASGDTLLEPVPDGGLVPAEQAQELLKRPRRGAGGVGDRLDALASKVRRLALDVGVEVAAGRDPAETVVELLEVVGQGGSNESSVPL